MKYLLSFLRILICVVGITFVISIILVTLSFFNEFNLSQNFFDFFIITSELLVLIILYLILKTFLKKRFLNK